MITNSYLISQLFPARPRVRKNPFILITYKERSSSRPWGRRNQGDIFGSLSLALTIMAFFSSLSHMPYLATLLLMLLLGACSSAPISDDSPADVQYREGEQLLEDKRYLEALERFRILKTRYPYSNFAAKATLRIADVYYNQAAFIEAASAYRIFTDLYPKHEKAAYALYREGLSKNHLVPDVPERDLNDAYGAIYAFRKLNNEYPNNEYKDEAKKKLRSLQDKLAAKEENIGNFYFTREYYRAAAERYRRLVDLYPDVPVASRALYRLAYSLEQVGEYDKSKQAVKLLQDRHPKSRYVKQASRIIEKMNKSSE